jgi:hypothetical protein
MAEWKHLRLAGNEYRYDPESGALERPDYLHGGWERLPDNFDDRDEIISMIDGTYIPHLYVPQPRPPVQIVDMRLPKQLIRFGTPENVDVAKEINQKFNVLRQMLDKARKIEPAPDEPKSQPVKQMSEFDKMRNLLKKMKGDS